jgi:hypothetical protein
VNVTVFHLVTCCCFILENGRIRQPKRRNKDHHRLKSACINSFRLLEQNRLLNNLSVEETQQILSFRQEIGQSVYRAKNVLQCELRKVLCLILQLDESTGVLFNNGKTRYSRSFVDWGLSISGRYCFLRLQRNLSWPWDLSELDVWHFVCYCFARPAYLYRYLLDFENKIWYYITWEWLQYNSLFWKKEVFKQKMFVCVSTFVQPMRKQHFRISAGHQISAWRRSKWH